MQGETHLALGPPEYTGSHKSAYASSWREEQLLYLWTGIISALPIGGFQRNMWRGPE